MSEKNPFTISFSREPEEYIRRPEQVERVVDTFTRKPVTDQLFVITGIRGSGKTVFMTTIANELERRKDWIVIRSTPTGEIIEYIASELLRIDVLKQTDIQIDIPLPLSGHIEVSRQREHDTSLSVIDRSLESMAKHERNLLITIDEITNTTQMKEFASAFQIFIGKKYPIYFLGTGLYRNIQALKNEQNMTFLYRAPRIDIGPLNMPAIARKYQQVFDIGDKEAADMSRLTQGYSYAFQALGYTYWENGGKDMKKVLHDYDDLLDESSYSKLWTELSDTDKRICRAMAETDECSVKAIRQVAGISSNQFTVYRERLRNAGLLNVSEYGKATFALPRFKEFIKERSMYYDIPD